ncbi:hypothetical protein [Rhodovulum visakhapatnamense]|uniref:Uncharacterized protein n=1 Tax=Rhodovulum visakhapatnamense TaxID=364297 RepID=A0A4R8G745_9RHOB|nr:hypothetical protein [Rhodovulum visakhapatnamense]TDX31168.1 hypothetical protein EV657_10514 [Rhodovulum visakhapatnamense]
MSDDITATDQPRDPAGRAPEPDWILKFSIKGGDIVEWIAAKSAVFGALEELKTQDRATGPLSWFFLPMGAINMGEVLFVTIRPRPPEPQPEPEPARRARFSLV